MQWLVNRVVNSTDTFRELLVLYVVVVLIGAEVFSFAEDKSYGDSVWWALVTAMTVGYGDYVPVTMTGRVAAGVLMHIIPLFIIPLIIVRILKTVVKDEHAFTHAEQEKIKADLDAIKKALKID